MKSRSSVDETKQKLILKKKLGFSYFESPEEQIRLAIEYNDIDLFTNLFETHFKQPSHRSVATRFRESSKLHIYSQQFSHR